ncbi:MAG: nucleotidyltransferase family protein [Desulfobacteraceae bacterium]|jgi:hypothetical protein
MKRTRDFTRETELLVLCSRKTIDHAVKKRIVDLVAEPVDWECILRMSVKHKTYPLVHATLEAVCPDSVPVDVMARLGSWCVRNAARNMVLCRALSMVLDLLTNNGIQALPFKGPVLAESVYGDTSLRVYSDLDLLVSKKDAFKARNLLVEVGFIPDLHLDEFQVVTYLNKENFFRLTGSDGMTVIDLHWEMSGRYSLIPMYLEDFEKHIVVQDILGRNVKTLSPPALLVYLSLHNASHGWDSLEAAACMAEVICSSNLYDGEAMMAMARRYHAVRALLAALHVSKELYHVRLPAEICKAMGKDKQVVRFADGIIAKLLDFGDASQRKTWSWRFSMTHLIIRDNLTDAILYVCRLIFLPTVKEWMLFPLSPPFTPLYYGLRPLRLVFEALRDVVRRIPR